MELLGGSARSLFLHFNHLFIILCFGLALTKLTFDIVKINVSISGKATLVGGGRSRDGTAFGGHKVEQLCKELSGAGYHYAGKDFMMSGITGKPVCDH